MGRRDEAGRYGQHQEDEGPDSRHGCSCGDQVAQSRQVPYPVRRTTASLAGNLRFRAGCPAVPSLASYIDRSAASISECGSAAWVGYAATPMENDGTIWLPSAMAMQ